MADAASVLDLITREEAAERCAVSPRTFDRHIAPHVPRVQIGTCVRYSARDIAAWLEKAKRGRSVETPAPASISCGSASRVVVLTDRRAREIEERLSRAPRKSTKPR